MRWVSLVILVLLTACSSVKPSEPRTINLWHKYSGERVRGMYWTGTDYDSGIMHDIRKLFRDREADEAHRIDPRLIDQMYALLAALALPEDTEVELVSGYRDPTRNRKLASRDTTVARDSLHTKGQAADIRIAGVGGKAVAAVSRTMQAGGVSYYEKTGHIHVDTGDVRTWKSR